MPPGETPILSFIEEVTGSPRKNYLWLRLLSYMEYIGYRKMVKALDYQEVHKGVFHHLTDEIRHSFMLKELAEKSGGAVSLEVNELQELRQLGEEYFQSLDREVQCWVSQRSGAENPYLCYLLTSYLIEVRAMKVYPAYFASLSDAPAKYIVQQIIRDESEHLNYLQDRMRFIDLFSGLNESSLFLVEQSLFEDLLRGLSAQWSVPVVSAPRELETELI